MTPYLSIITVVYNDKEHISKTLESVGTQTSEYIEHIVIDGASSDGTAIICQNYCRNNPRIKFISERDTGIYDAMNKGLRTATGHWLIFLNSGDTFFNSKTAQRITNFAKNHEDCDMIVCDITRDKNDFNRISPRILRTSYKESIPCSHQACLINRQTHLRHPYDLSYRLAADYDMMYTILDEGGKWTYWPHILSSYMSGGISDRRKFEVRKEWILVKCRNKLRRVPLYLLGRCLVRAKRLIKNCLGDS